MAGNAHASIVSRMWPNDSNRSRQAMRASNRNVSSLGDLLPLESCHLLPEKEKYNNVTEKIHFKVSKLVITSETCQVCMYNKDNLKCSAKPPTSSFANN